MTPRRRVDGSTLFAELSLVAAATALTGVVAYAFAADTSSSGTSEASSGADDTPSPGGLDGTTRADPDASASDVLNAAAAAMAEVTSVEFRLDRTGAPIFIDQYDSLALDGLLGQFTVPTKARAQLTVTVQGGFTTEIGAVAVDDEIWVSNPVTGSFETLPDGFDIDPSRFFDPEGGWRPLLANLRDAEVIGVETASDGGDRYHVRGTAPAAEVRNITVGLVRDQDVPVELWIHPGTFLVTRAEFVTLVDGEESQWVLELGRFGDEFTIEPPSNVREGVTS